MSWLDRFRKPKERTVHRVIEVGDDDFRIQVIQRSFKMPVMVDFWAAWCGPCRQLGPVLERLADQPDSGFILAKLNTEANQKTAAQFSIRSIPAVKVFRNGQIVGEFVGVMPSGNVRNFMDQIIAAPPPPAPLKGSEKPAKRLQQGVHHLKKVRGFEAFVLLADFPDSREAAQAQKLLPLARFLCDMDDGDGFTGQKAVDELYLDVVDALHEREAERALTCLTAVLPLATEAEQKRAKAVMAAILALLGEKHPLTQAYSSQVIEVSDVTT